jgi:hypothetical protein
VSSEMGRQLRLGDSELEACYAWAKRLIVVNWPKLYVATTGKPYPIQITKTGRETAHITLTNYNQPATPTPPTNTINISQLEHKRS